MAPSVAASALRESFGDRKVPDISRKITACVACRKLKIKCQIDHAGPPCRRCKARGLSCTVNKSLQMLLENDASWKEKLEQRVTNIERVLDKRPNVHSPPRASSVGQSAHASPFVVEPRIRANSEVTATPQRVDSVSLNLACSLGAFPASSMLNPPSSEDLIYSSPKLDLISRGVISRDTATELYNYYLYNLDSLLHHILAESDDLSRIRARSSILTGAICTVAAFCMNSIHYSACLEAFKKEVSSKLFLAKYDFDDVRALCIGAMWLREESSALNGMAVRLAAELDLHRCITKMPHTKRACYERTRLHFLVYLCDHHCSLVYGRPPMTREWRSLRPPSTFLQSDLSVPADVRLIGQVEQWSISRRVFERFGADVESSIVVQRASELVSLGQMYDKWQEEWQDALTNSTSPNPQSLFLFEFYLHAAKIYLFSHVFRGISPGTTGALTQKRELLRSAQHALDSANAIIRLLINSYDQPSFLEKLPSYFATMVAFACVCMVQIHRHGEIVSTTNSLDITTHLRQAVAVLKLSSVAKNPRHMLPSVLNGMEKVLATYDEGNQGRSDEEQLNSMELDFDFDLFTAENMNFNLFGLDDDCVSGMGDIVSLNTTPPV